MAKNLLNYNRLYDLLNDTYVKSDIQAHIYSYSIGYLASLGLEAIDANDYVNAITTYSLKTAIFVYTKIKKHPDQFRKMLRSNTVGTLISSPQLLLHLISLQKEILTPYLRYPISYAVGATGNFVRWYLDHQKK